ITLVMDNLNTHTPGSLYEIFLPAIFWRFYQRNRLITQRFSFIGQVGQLRACINHPTFLDLLCDPRYLSNQVDVEYTGRKIDTLPNG
ncbi:MAG: hypothetical protein KJP23_19925, partial [Deltaproteobacteria bacterium]|nr:hypothetical protein [Deltaproteobacteria bacterium]